MEYREAIERLKDHFTHHNDGRPTPKLDEVEKLVYIAMKKQIPMKPNIQQNEYDNNFLECPSCGGFLGYHVDWEDEYYPVSYCDFCGQKLDFEYINL